MIKISELITYLRAKLTTYRVYGSAELAAAKDDSSLILPAFYVSLGNLSATDVSDPPEVEQDYDERIVIMFVANNKLDRTGVSAQDSVYYARYALLSALLNFEPDPLAHPLRYVGDSYLEMDAARYWHRFEFKCLGKIGTAEGVTKTFDNFDKFYADWNLAEADASTHPNAQDHINDIYEG